MTTKSRPTPQSQGQWVLRSIPGFTLALALSAGLAGCMSPMAVETERDLRKSVVESAKRELRESEQYPNPLTTQREPGVSRLGLSDRVLPELHKMAGPESYDPRAIVMGDDLHGIPTTSVAVSLERVVRTTVQHNIALQFARLAPAVSEADVVAAEAAFDWTLFSNFNWNDADEPRTRPLVGGVPSGNRFDQFQLVSSTTGLKRQLATGGQFTIQQELTYTDNQAINGGGQTPNPAGLLGVTVQYDQPLLRNFGSEVSQAQIRINRNAERSKIADLKRELIRDVTEAERTYWRLTQAHRDLLILQRLLERGEKVRDQLKSREKLDATPAQIADAVARVERRKADVYRAQTVLRNQSDKLKSLMNDPSIPLGSEILLVPADSAIDEPVTFSMLDSVEKAVTNRPEVQQAILSIDDTSIRQTVADRARLPQLDLRLQTKWSALDDYIGSTYEYVFDGSYVNYLVGLVFEQPIGNRRAEADYRKRRLERMQAVVSYRNTIQQVLLEVKNSLNNVTTNYRLIEQTRTSRFAATEVLRALEVEKQTIGRYTVERLDLEFNRQESLAQAEREEIQALADYNTAIAELAAAMGSTLERNQIEFVVPTPEEALRNGGDITTRIDAAKMITPEPAPASTPAAGPAATPASTPESTSGAASGAAPAGTPAASPAGTPAASPAPAPGGK